MPAARINLIYKVYSDQITGLERDALILEAAVASRYQVHHCKLIEHGRLKQLGIFQNISSRSSAYLSSRLKNFDLNIFLEVIRPELLPLAQVNLLIPNQELFAQADLPLLDSIDAVLCKTHYAEQIFAQITPHYQQIGFSSQDRQLPNACPDYSQFFHLAGKSGKRRGTQQILQFWKAHPDLPKLTVVAHGLNLTPYQTCANLQIFNQYLADAQIQQLQNQIGLQICLSQAEGFGHFMVEAMSAQACVITTDAPPMNELVTPDRGYLVGLGVATAVEGYFDQRFQFDPDQFEQQIWELVQTPEAEKRAKGLRARRWYEQNQQAFQQNLLRALDQTQLWGGLRPGGREVCGI